VPTFAYAAFACTCGNSIDAAQQMSPDQSFVGANFAQTETAFSLQFGWAIKTRDKVAADPPKSDGCLSNLATAAKITK